MFWKNTPSTASIRNFVRQEHCWHRRRLNNESTRQIPFVQCDDCTIITYGLPESNGIYYFPILPTVNVELETMQHESGCCWIHFIATKAAIEYHIHDIRLSSLIHPEIRWCDCSHNDCAQNEFRQNATIYKTSTPRPTKPNEWEEWNNMHIEFLSVILRRQPHKYGCTVSSITIP
jgi:hypothetical protein